MGKDNVSDRSDVHVQRALGRIREALEGAAPTNENDVLDILSESLFEIRQEETSHDYAGSGAAVTSLSNAVAGRSQVDAVLQWLRTTEGFAQAELELAERSGIFMETSDGKVLLREQPMSDALAAIFVAGIALLTGAWLTWVLFASEGSLLVIAASFAIGGLFGFFVGKALDKSFRFAKLRAKILRVAPRFEYGLAVRL